MNARLTRRFGMLFSALTVAGCAMQPSGDETVGQTNLRVEAVRTAAVKPPTLEQSLAAAGTPALTELPCVHRLFRKSRCGADAVTPAEVSKVAADMGADADDSALADAEPIDPNASDVSNFHQTGSASWYGNRFHGRRTASGERYDMHEMTAAHRSLPLLSYVRVENTLNHRSVIVKINDRGPFHSRRILDLSAAAASALGMRASGTEKVAITGLSPQEAEAALRRPLLASR